MSESENRTFEQTLRRRRMVRNYRPDPVDPALVDHFLELARRAPSAGNSAATAFLVLDQPGDRARYWDCTLPEPKRQRFRWQGLLIAPVLIVVLTRPERYVERYAEQDKARPGLGEHQDHWPVPYWWVDSGAVIQNLLLSITDAGLGACLFGLFDHEPRVLETFGVPAGWRAVGTIALGYARSDEPGRSARRPRPELASIVHRGGWNAKAASEFG